MCLVKKQILEMMIGQRRSKKPNKSSERVAERGWGAEEEVLVRQRSRKASQLIPEDFFYEVCPRYSRLAKRKHNHLLN